MVRERWMTENLRQVLPSWKRCRSDSRYIDVGPDRDLSRKSMLEIGNQIIDLLETNRDAQQVVRRG